MNPSIHTTLCGIMLAVSPVPAFAQGPLFLPVSLSPANTELAGYALRPFAQVNSRVQMFFDATEVGRSSLIADGLSLRFDGPLPRVGAPGPFTVQRLTLRIGATAVPLPGAVFAANLTQPLTTVLDGPWTYSPDPGTAAPHGFGDPNGSLTFPFLAPVAVTIPAGGFLVVELVMQGNNMSSVGFAHPMVDGTNVGGGPTSGAALAYGQGCALPGNPAATIATSGSYAPGAAHFLAGQNLGPNALVLALVGVSDTTSSFGPLPAALPGTSCSLGTSADAWWILRSDAAGSIPVNTPAGALPVPANPALGGLSLYEQLLAYAPGANAFDFVLSDARDVQLGTLAPPSIGVYTVSHGSLHDALVADEVAAFGYAVRLATR